MTKGLGVPEEVAAALARGATVLTGRARAAREIRRSVDEANRVAGMGGWEPARVFAWDSWTAGLWRELLLRGDVEEMLLNRTQEAAVWREVIEADRGLATLRSVDALAGLAAEAWGELARYGGLGRLAGSAMNGDMEAFGRWAEGFGERCRERGYLAQARLEAALRRTWRERPESRPGEKELLLVGFDRMLPAQERLLEDLGCSIGRERVVAAADGLVIAAGSEAEEIRAGARWVRERLLARPEASVGVIVPGLRGSARRKAGIDRVLREVLAPEAEAVTWGAGLPYEFSTGVGLDRTALGRAALAILALGDGALGVEQVGELLLSPYFAGGAEGAARAEFEAYEMRRGPMLRPEMTLDGLVRMVERSRREMAKTLAALRRMQAVVGRYAGERRTYSDWSETMREVLGAAGWVDGGGDSVWLQTREAWESALDEVATLDFAGGRVGFGRALEGLREVAAGTVFAAESRGAAVQVMGPEESAGLRFDAVWFMGAGEQSWPARVSGSPLVAWGLRRELGMPGADGARDFAQAGRVTERIVRGCEEIVFSYARETEEGRQKVSEVVQRLGLREVEAEVEEVCGVEVQVEAVEDSARLSALPDRVVAGGVSVLKAQAACAFHAFAAHRLFATEMEPRELGMNASERGNAVHGMLEGFWAEVETQAALRGLGAAERRRILGESIAATLRKARIVGESRWDEAYLEMQRQRLLRLGEAWLALEEGRAVAFTVERRESEERDVEIGPLRLSLRLDRVDQTAEGAVLIDYKTGAASTAGWLTERPDEPQLPLYAAFAGEMRLHAVAFGLVRAGVGMGLTGYEVGAGTLTRPAKMEAGSLEEQVEIWRGELVGLAEGFAVGDARVSPKRYPVTCRYCAHRLICRLDVPSLGADDEDEDGMEADLG